MSAEKSDSTTIEEETLIRIGCNVTDLTHKDALEYATKVLLQTVRRINAPSLDEIAANSPNVSKLIGGLLMGIRMGASKKEVRDFALAWANATTNSEPDLATC